MFTCTDVVVAAVVIFLFRNTISKLGALDAEHTHWSMNIYNTSSTLYTLKIMTGVTAMFVPLKLVYHEWIYLILQQRISNLHRSA